MSEPFHRETLRGGQKWSRVLKRHESLRLTDASSGGGAGATCVAALLYNAADGGERYNMPDTLKAQFTAFLTAGRVLYSDMGRILASITADTCGWHDTLTGHQDAAGAAARFGPGTYQERRNDWLRNTRDNVLVELAKHGLGRRDLHANLNLFAKVVTDEAGRFAWVPGNSRPGAHIELRMEMDVLVVLSNTPHPMDPATAYGPPPVALELRRVPPPGADDPCRLARAENGRGFTLTEGLFR
jgi:urea carboxylase-associated protein 2